LWVQVQAKDIQIVEGANVLNDRVTLDNKSCRPSFSKIDFTDCIRSTRSTEWREHLRTGADLPLG